LLKLFTFILKTDSLEVIVKQQNIVDVVLRKTWAQMSFGFLFCQ